MAIRSAFTTESVAFIIHAILATTVSILFFDFDGVQIVHTGVLLENLAKLFEKGLVLLWR